MTLIKTHRKNYKLLIILLLFPISANAQSYDGGGIKLGFSPHGYGWHGNPFNTNFYYSHLHDPPKINNFFVGLFFEFSKSKLFSTFGELDIKGRDYEFSSDDYNSSGQFTGTSSTSATVTYLSLSICEKIRYDIGKFSFYCYAGPRIDLYMIKNGYMSLLKQHFDLNNFQFGLNSGFGISFGKKHRVLLECYFIPDLTKHYSSATGDIVYKEYGFTIGYGAFFK
jgi:hypothetical protein